VPHNVYVGSIFRIEYAICIDGSMPAKSFIEGELDEKEQHKLATLFQRLGDAGKISNREQFRKLEGALWEFKHFQTRVACFQDGPTWYLTHGFIKKKDKWPPSELTRAERIRGEHFARKQVKGDRR